MAAPQTPTAQSSLAQPVTNLWGVGDERAKQLARLGIFTVDDLLLHQPRRYEDRRNFRSIKDLQLSEPMLTRGTVVAMGLKKFRKGTQSVFELVLEDDTARLHCRWWNLPFMEKYFEVGNEVVVFGKPLLLRPRTIDHPETEVVEGGEEGFVHFGRIVPVYPLTEGLPQRWLRGLVWRTLEKFERHIAEPWATAPATAERRARSETVSKLIFRPSNLPARFVKMRHIENRSENFSAIRVLRQSRSDAPYQLPARANAVHMLHFPEEEADAEIARQRLALDEFIALQVEIQSRRKKFEANAKALSCAGDNRLIKPFLGQLGFKLTEAQTKVLREIRKDMGGTHPMRRLLQGDVGSGKTAVAACTALMTLESGFNAALMVPTEILAEQHFRNFTKWFAPLGIKVELQTGNRKTASSIEHSTSLIIGTHALLTSSLELPRLGLVIIDEQHKFGVAQREQFVRKGNYPHLLVMTATPIPRTLGLTLYGDLDVSVIDALPPGRGSIKTFVRATNKLSKVWEFIRQRLAEGRQAYVVYPRVEDNTGGVKAVMKEHENLKAQLAPFRVGLLHGRLSSKEAEEVMAAFRGGTVNVLLATSLIEVGVDVSNATVMLVENAEAFGLAQLHQLRGRIGRGAHESHCILVSDAKNLEARERLRVLEETTDGFKIAEADLKLRGPGELLGRQQSGVPQFRFGDLVTDINLIHQARELAAQLCHEINLK